MQGAFETGIYRNLWSEYGYSEKEVKNRLEDAFQTNFLRNRRGTILP